jgi:predicted glycosyltransferase
MPSVTIRYPKKGSMSLKMFFLLPKIIFGIIREHQLLKRIIKSYDIDVVISDNRYGLWKKNVPSIFITHQLWIKSPKKLRCSEPIINFINHWFIKKYDECWVPDFEDSNNLSGELSHFGKAPQNVSYIGIISRFNLNLEEPEYHEIPKGKFDILVILSGPEPQRSILEENLVNQILGTNYKTLILKGKPGKILQTKNQNIWFINHLDSFNLKNLITKTKVIICRSGYSSIMDLVALSKSAILIPTPGQTEQEYLAEYLSEKKWFYSIQQKEFELKKSIAGLEKCKINCKFEINELLKNALP